MPEKPDYNDLYMKYIGALSLLARLSDQIHDEEDQQCIEMALKDCTDAYPTMEYRKCYNGFIFQPKPVRETQHA